MPVSCRREGARNCSPVCYLLVPIWICVAVVPHPHGFPVPDASPSGRKGGSLPREGRPHPSPALRSVEGILPVSHLRAFAYKRGHMELINFGWLMNAPAGPIREKSRQ
jgi:hypothetical protein